MNIKEYYQSKFRHDIASFMPDQRFPYFGHSWDFDCKGLECITEGDRAFFLICLYFTVLADQAMYTHYRSYYEQFESLTKYPKFCHGLGQFQKNPRSILLAPIEKELVAKTSIDMLLNDGMELFVDEVWGFFSQRMPHIKPPEFFDKLLFDSDVQIPTIITLVNPEMKNDTGVLAYEALKGAVKNRNIEK
jgi:hypothetical protein